MKRREKKHKVESGEIAPQYDAMADADSGSSSDRNSNNNNNNIRDANDVYYDPNILTFALEIPQGREAVLLRLDTRALLALMLVSRETNRLVHQFVSRFVLWNASRPGAMRKIGYDAARLCEVTSLYLLIKSRVAPKGDKIPDGAVRELRLSNRFPEVDFHLLSAVFPNLTHLAIPDSFSTLRRTVVLPPTLVALRAGYNTHLTTEMLCPLTALRSLSVGAMCGPEIKKLPASVEELCLERCIPSIFTPKFLPKGIKRVRFNACRPEPLYQDCFPSSLESLKVGTEYVHSLLQEGILPPALRRLKASVIAVSGSASSLPETCARVSLSAEIDHDSFNCVSHNVLQHVKQLSLMLGVRDIRFPKTFAHAVRAHGEARPDHYDLFASRNDKKQRWSASRAMVPAQGNARVSAFQRDEETDDYDNNGSTPFVHARSWNGAADGDAYDGIDDVQRSFGVPNNVLPSGLCSLRLTDNLALSKSACARLVHLRVIRGGYWPCGRASNLPRGMTAFHAGSAFTGFVASLPPSITVLALGPSFMDVPIGLPPMLTALSFGNNFNASIAGAIPESVQHLRFGTRFCKPIDCWLPRSLLTLRFGSGFVLPIGMSAPLPRGMTHLWAHCAYPFFEAVTERYPRLVVKKCCEHSRWSADSVDPVGRLFRLASANSIKWTASMMNPLLSSLASSSSLPPLRPPVLVLPHASGASVHGSGNGDRFVDIVFEGTGSNGNRSNNNNNNNESNRCDKGCAEDSHISDNHGDDHNVCSLACYERKFYRSLEHDYASIWLDHHPSPKPPGTPGTLY